MLKLDNECTGKDYKRDFLILTRSKGQIDLKYLCRERQSLGNKWGLFHVQSLPYNMVGSMKTWLVIGTIAAQSQDA